MARQSPASKMAARKPLEAVSDSTSPGGLHRSLGIPAGQKIGTKRIAAATHSKNAKTRRQARLAQTYNKYRDGGD